MSRSKIGSPAIAGTLVAIARIKNRILRIVSLPRISVPSLAPQLFFVELSMAHPAPHHHQRYLYSVTMKRGRHPLIRPPHLHLNTATTVCGAAVKANRGSLPRTKRPSWLVELSG